MPSARTLPFAIFIAASAIAGAIAIGISIPRHNPAPFLTIALLIAAASFALRCSCSRASVAEDGRIELEVELMRLDRRVADLTEERDDLREALDEATGHSIENDVRIMCIAYGQPAPDVPQIPDADTVELRITLLDEEVDELKKALRAGDLVEVADGVADVITIAYGTGVAAGIPTDDVLAEVHRTNMLKIDPETGLVLKRADGKTIKPVGWKGPRIAEILAAHGAPTPHAIAS